MLLKTLAGRRPGLRGIHTRPLSSCTPVQAPRQTGLASLLPHLCAGPCFCPPTLAMHWESQNRKRCSCCQSGKCRKSLLPIPEAQGCQGSTRHQQPVPLDCPTRPCSSVPSSCAPGTLPLLPSASLAESLPATAGEWMW